MGTGWLSPSGEFIECDPHDHWSMAVELGEKMGLSEEDQNIADDFLMEHGWIRISFMLMLDTGYVFSYYEIASENQRLFLRRFLEENQESLSKQGIRNLYWLRVIDDEEREMLMEKIIMKKDKKITYEEICKAYGISDIGDFSDGYHTFNDLYYQRCVLFATIVNCNKQKAWKTRYHELGTPIFRGGWFLVAVDTPSGTYGYHYENKYWDMFNCVEIPKAKHWDGYTDKDVTRLLSLCTNLSEI